MPFSELPKAFRYAAAVLLIVITASSIANLLYAISASSSISAANRAASVARDNGVDLKKSSARRECANEVTATFDAETTAKQANFDANIVNLIILSQTNRQAAHHLELDMKQQAAVDRHRPGLTALINQQCPAPLAITPPKGS